MVGENDMFTYKVSQFPSNSFSENQGNSTQ
jgi:hypothetical protein